MTLHSNRFPHRSFLIPHGVTITFTLSAFPSLVALTSDQPTSEAVIVPPGATLTRSVSELAQRISRPSSALPAASTTSASIRIVCERGSATLSGTMITRATGVPLLEGPDGPFPHASAPPTSATASPHLSRAAIPA